MRVQGQPRTAQVAAQGALYVRRVVERQRGVPDARKAVAEAHCQYWRQSGGGHARAGGQRCASAASSGNPASTQTCVSHHVLWLDRAAPLSQAA